MEDKTSIVGKRDRQTETETQREIENKIERKRKLAFC